MGVHSLREVVQGKGGCPKADEANGRLSKVCQGGAPRSEVIS